MDLVMNILALIPKLLALYTAFLSLFCLLPRRRIPPSVPEARFAVLLPARNEEAVIAATVAQLLRQNYPRDQFDIYVIPNNCADATEDRARAAGAKILTCRCPVRNKGDALREAFSQLSGRYDAYCVFDADNLVHPDFLARMSDAIARGAACAKGKHMALNPYDSWVSGCYDIYFENFSLLYSRPRDALKLSAKLVGTGFMVTDDLMARLEGWNTQTMAEDLEFAAQCAQAGIRVHYVPEALTYDEEPVTFSLSMRQRRRWAAGVQQVANLYIPKLLAAPPTRYLPDMLVTLALIYAQLLALIPAVYGFWGMTIIAATIRLGLLVLGFCAGGWGLALLLTLTAGRKPEKMWRSILLYPLFLASWYPLHIIALFSKPKTWRPIAHKGTPSPDKL